MALKNQQETRKPPASEASTVTYGEVDGTLVGEITLAEEYLRVDKQQVKTNVQIHKTVESRQERMDIPLENQRVEVRRVPKHQMISEPVQIRQEGNTLIIPVVEEVVVLEKRLRLIEEVHITTTKEKHTHLEQVDLRREKITIERDSQD